MIEKPETLQILKKMLVIAAISLLLIPIIDFLIGLNVVGVEGNAILSIIKNPIAYFLALFLWFRVLIMLIDVYMEKDDFSKDLTSTSMIIIIGLVIQQINLAVLSVFHDAFTAIAPFVTSVGTLILLFGFITLFYHLMKYIWVKI